MAKKRAAAYIRVSTASAGQTHSYEFQEQYWRGRFVNDEDIELVGIYADKGISGSSIYKRPQFLMMMQDARDGRFDVIYSKSVSRFSRNTVDFLTAIRELRELGIEVIFEKENIHTLQPTSELFLTIAAAIAENDLQVDAERQRWSIKHRIENGWISIGNGMFGYRMVADNQLEIVPDEAAIIREIYERYIAGEGSQKLANWLNSQGVISRSGKPWQQQNILKMIRNEKYKGDSLMLKKVRRDGRTLNNTNGVYSQQYYIEHSHEGIVSEETWQKAQQVMAARRYEKKQPTDPTYAFTSIIECAICGSHYRHKVNNCGFKWQTDIWACGRKLRSGKGACDNTQIKNSVLEEKFIECYNEFVRTRPVGETVKELRSQLERLYENERDLAKLHQQHLISENAYRFEQQRIKEKIKITMAQLASRSSKDIRESDFTIITEFDPEKVKKFITKVRVSNGTVTFVFYNGVEMTRAYSNGQPGNKPGWNRKEGE